jgi:hypothetical protein
VEHELQSRHLGGDHHRKCPHAYQISHRQARWALRAGVCNKYNVLFLQQPLQHTKA